MRSTDKTRIFGENITPSEIAEHVATILCDGHPDLHTPKRKREFEDPPKRSLFARAVKWEDKCSIRKAIYFLENDGMGENDIQIIRDAAKRTMQKVFGKLINQVSQDSEINITISDKHIIFNDIYYMGARFMGRDFTDDEKSMIRKELVAELKKQIYPRVVNAFGRSSAEKQLAKIHEKLKPYPTEISKEAMAAKLEDPTKIPEGLG